MSSFIDVRAETASPSFAGGARGIVRWVCTSNPFYVVSALLVCLGLWGSFGAQARVEQTWALMASMAGYTLLLAVTACLLVRFVGVWDDVRTVLLLVVLMFLATSVTFDETLSPDPRTGLPRHPLTGVACYLGGLAFAVAVSEGVLRGMRLSLPAWYRTPYYLILALFFLYPLALSPWLDRPGSEALSWALFGFSPLAGLVFLTLLPAIRRGPGYVAGNGSPWPWPFYPWALFAFLGFAVGARTFLLCWSMHHVEMSVPERHIFGPYFLVPFGLALAVLLLEMGLAWRHRGPQMAALGLSAGLVGLTLIGHRPDPLYQQFLDQFIWRLGATPFYLSLLATAGFFALAGARRVPFATGALTAALGALAVVGPSTIGLGDLVRPRPWPILAIAALQLGLGLRVRSAGRVLLGAGCVVIGVTLGLPSTGATLPRGPIAFHLALAALLVVGASFDDALGRRLRDVGAALTLVACGAVTFGRFETPAGVPNWLVEAYPLALAGVLAGYGVALGHRPAVVAAALAVSGWLASAAGRGYVALRQVVAGLDQIALGLAFFVLAMVISLAKGGLLSRRPASAEAKAPTST